MISKHQDTAKVLLYIFLGTLALIALILVTTGRNGLVPLLVIANGFSFYGACWFAIKAKGRSGWWILAPLFAVYLGAFIVWLLEDRSPAPPEPGGLPEWAR